MKKHNILDLFCGAGGLSYGFHLAGFKIKGGVDFDDYARETHALNFKDGYHDWSDITKVTDEEIKERYLKNEENKIDVIVGGPPCQGFSAANMWQTEEDKKEKNQLFYHFIRFVEIIKPKVFLMENVRQILTKDKGFAKNEIIKTLSSLGYNINVDVLHANNYGVPQKRVRAFFIGVRNDFDIKFDFNNLKKQSPVTVGNALEDLYYYDTKVSKATTIEDVLDYKNEKKLNKYQEYLREGAGTTLKNHNIKYPMQKVQDRMSHVKEGENWRSVPEELWDTVRNNRHSSAYRRLDSKTFSITIDTGHMNYFHPKYNRVPTVRESARLQSFPDKFIFAGNQGAQFRQVGNAVPPLLGKALAQEIKNIIDKGMKKMNNEIKTVDLFCGAGGFSIGFEKQGFESILAIDMWKDAIETYNYNRKEKVGKNLDIHDYTNEQINELKEKHEIDGIIGGPPCQGFSMVGTRKEGDERNSLYLEYVRFVKEISPKFFILENVKGLLNMKGGPESKKGFFTKEIIERFTNLGYNVNHKLLKASEFGVPQNRERVFFVGLRKDLYNDTFFEFPIGDPKRAVSTSEAINDLPSLDNNEVSTEYRTPPQNDYQKMLRKYSKKVLNNDPTIHTKQTVDIIKMVPDGGNIRDLPVEYYSVRNYNTAFKRMNSQLPSTTIDCGHRNYFHYKENRVPTVRESARIQSFPDNYFFTGSKTSQYKQVGNAVPSYLAEHLAIEIKKIIK